MRDMPALLKAAREYQRECVKHEDLEFAGLASSLINALLAEVIPHCDWDEAAEIMAAYCGVDKDQAVPLLEFMVSNGDIGEPKGRVK